MDISRLAIRNTALDWLRGGAPDAVEFAQVPPMSLCMPMRCPKDDARQLRLCGFHPLIDGDEGQTFIH